MRLDLAGGDRLSGTVVEEDERSVTLRTAFGAIVPVPRDRILSLTRLTAAAAGPPLPAEGQAEGQSDGESPPLRLSGELELGAALISSVRSRRDYLANLDLTFARGDDSLRLQGLIDRQQAAGVRLRDRQQLGLTFRSEFRPPYFVTFSGRYLRDPPIGLRRRASASAQLGRHLIDEDQHRLTVRLGPGFYDERREDGRHWLSPLATWGLRYELGFTGLLERFSFRHNQEGSLDPRFRPLRLLLETETSLRYRVTDRVFIALSGRVDFDSLSPDSTRTLDRRLQLRVGFDW